ncbi:MAG TPA: hypothetical protein VN397_04765 [Candidatus Methylomirabilis sp.]|nr:hypothetical protein [Candidatus Methylomirabilis sp.]
MANLFDIKLGKLFPALGQLHLAGVTDEMWEKIGGRDGEYARIVFDALMAKMNGTVTTHDPIFIPADATAEGLVRDAKTEFERAGIPLTHLNIDLLHLIRLDLDLVRGKTCKVFIRNFGRDWETSEGREWQKSVGADGNTAAYLAWVTKTKPMGWTVSIPSNDIRLFRSSDGYLCAPNFNRDGAGREFNLFGVWHRWDGDGSLVAFSAI